jgi:hypothetical protein
MKHVKKQKRFLVVLEFDGEIKNNLFSLGK